MNTETILLLRSVTYAMKAKRLLEARGIKAKVVKPTPSSSEHGCAYGVSVTSRFADSALMLLKEHGMTAVIRR